MERSKPDTFIVQIEQPQSSANDEPRDLDLDRSHRNEALSTPSSMQTYPYKHHLMFTKKFEHDPMRENMAISIVSIFFCCFVGILATIQAAKALEYVRGHDVASAFQATVRARKLAVCAIAGGLAIFISCLLINCFFIRKGNYKSLRYGHIHLTNITFEPDL